MSALGGELAELGESVFRRDLDDGDPDLASGSLQTLTCRTPTLEEVSIPL